MPYNPNLQDLSILISRAFKSGDIAERADQAGLSERRLITILSEKADQIWKAGAEESAGVSKLMQAYEDEVTRRVESKLILRRLFLGFARVFYRYLLPLAVGALLWLYISSFIKNGWIFTVSAYLTFGKIGSLFGTAVLLLILFLVYRSLLGNYTFDEFKLRDTVQEEDDLVADKKKIAEAMEALNNKVIDQGIKPLLKERIDAGINPSFTASLPALEYSGLSEVFNSDNEMDTDAKRKLEFMLDTMPGGSIGVAGPRGAGKTTLLKSICKDSLADTDKLKVISVLTSSPVEYQARDFILHLFSSVCFKTLEVTTGRKTVHTAWEEIDEIRQPVTASFAQFLPVITRASFIIGFTLVILSLAIAGFTMKSKPAADAPTPAGTTANPSAGSGERSSAATQPAEPAAANTPAQPAASSTVARFISVLEIKPGVLLMWGIILILVAFTIAYGAGRISRHDFEWRSLLRSRRRLDFNPAVKLKDSSHLTEIDEEARKWLKEIKFQQSYTSGWSGALKLPIGLEGGLNTAVSLAQQQLSLPDITKGFCDFLNLLARDFRVIIGIDELDKLESDEAAQRFLNEIKSVFGLGRVFYLISVSESAMSNFERRGLPFRDVFDSSFDNIVYVDYLSLSDAKRLVARRVIAMPPPFIHLCYCLSGGLARDLVRACRNMMELTRASHDSENGQTSRPDTVSGTSGALIEADLKLKIHAMIVAAKKFGKESDASWFLDKLHKIEAELGSVTSLLQNYADLIRSSQSTTRAAAAPKLQLTDFMQLYETLKQANSTNGREKSPGAPDITALYEEFATYIYYCSTLLQLFDDNLNDATIIKAENDKSFDLLARARQSLSVNSRVTRSMIGDFRTSLDIKTPPPNIPPPINGSEPTDAPQAENAPQPVMTNPTPPVPVAT